MTFLGWLSDLLERLSDLQLGDKKVTLNHLGEENFWVASIPPGRSTIKARPHLEDGGKSWSVPLGRDAIRDTSNLLKGHFNI